MYTSKGYTVVMPNGHTSSFKTPDTATALDDWQKKQKEIDVEWPDRPDISPVKPEQAGPESFVVNGDAVVDSGEEF